MKPNQFLLKAAAMKEAEKRALIRFVGQKCLDVMTVALNEEYGFGADRLNRLSASFAAIMDEYGGMVDTDAEYADEKLRQRVKQIMEGANG